MEEVKSELKVKKAEPKEMSKKPTRGEQACFIPTKWYNKSCHSCWYAERCLSHLKNNYDYKYEKPKRANSEEDDEEMFKSPLVEEEKKAKRKERAAARKARKAELKAQKLVSNATPDFKEAPKISTEGMSPDEAKKAARKERARLRRMKRKGLL